MPSSLLTWFLAVVVVATVARGPACAEDLGEKLAPVGQSIQQGVQDTGAAIGRGAQAIGSSIQERVEPATKAVRQRADEVGPAVEKGAQDTGNFLDRTTKDFRDGAQRFFVSVGNFFSGKQADNR